MASRRKANPRVSIGLPVYNGERYLVESIDSILTQSFTDFELIICDNLSTDRTREICREYQDRDPRVQFHENSRNLGIFGNHAEVFSKASGEYFCWAADDDIRTSDFLESCVAILDAAPDVVVCYGASQIIDEQGEPIDAVEAEIDCENPDPVRRFEELIRMDYRLEPVMGLFRVASLREVGAHGSYPDSDRVLLAEMGLRGAFRRSPELVLYRREHKDRSIRAHPSRHERQVWIDPTKMTQVAFPFHRQLFEYLRSIAKGPLTASQRLACYHIMLRWAWRQRRHLWEDYSWSIRALLRPVTRRLRSN